MDEKKVNITVRNISEDLVDMYLDECIINSGMCDCKICRADVKAIALNNFPTHYVATEMGEALALARILNSQYQANIIISIMDAAGTVKEKPRHERK